MYVRRGRRVVIWGMGLGGIAILAVGGALHGIARFRIGPVPGSAWTWLERLSWLAGLGSLLIAAVALWAARSNPAGRTPLRVPGPARRGMPVTASIDSPVGQLDGPVRGRADLLENLAGLFDRRADPGDRVHVLYGLGGSRSEER